MVVINDWLWETLFTMKKLYDHGKKNLLNRYANHVLDGDDVGEVAMQAIYEVFADTLDHWDEQADQDTYVFFDPVFDEFGKLCKAYETKKGIPAYQNPHREDIGRALRSALCFSDYSYEYLYFDGTQKDGQAKLILKLYPDFCHMYEITGGLLEAYDAFENQIKVMKEELNMRDQIIVFSEPEDEAPKEAA